MKLCARIPGSSLVVASIYEVKQYLDGVTISTYVTVRRICAKFLN